MELFRTPIILNKKNKVMKILMSTLIITFLFMPSIHFYAQSFDLSPIRSELDCSPKYYTPNTHHLPIMSKERASNITLGINYRRIELQASQKITKNIVIKANGGLYTPINWGCVNHNGNTKFIELGAGYFKHFNNRWIFETYGMYAIEKMDVVHPKHNFSADSDHIFLSANLRRMGIQSSFGYKNQGFLLAFSSRFVKLIYQNIEGNIGYFQEDQQDYLRTNNNFLLLEPAVTIGKAINKFSFQFQLRYSANLTISDFRQNHFSSSFMMGYSF